MAWKVRARRGTEHPRAVSDAISEASQWTQVAQDFFSTIPLWKTAALWMCLYFRAPSNRLFCEFHTKRALPVSMRLDQYLQQRSISSGVSSAQVDKWKAV